MRGARIGVALAVTLFSSSAFANNGGLPGYSGKPTAISPQGETCNQCHSGGAAPTVTLNGPASLNAGQVAEYTLVVSTGLTRVGGGVAATDGVKLENVAGFRDSFGEMVQDAPLTVANGAATFRFKVTAPSSGTAIKLWAVGLAANNSGTNAGDKATHTTKDITIVGGVNPPPSGGTDAGAGSSSSGGGDDGGSSLDLKPGTTSSSSGGTSSSGGGGNTSASTDPNDPAGDDGANADGTDEPQTYGTRKGRSDGAATNDAMCSSSPIHVDGHGLAAAIAVMIGTVMLARRRKRA